MYSQIVSDSYDSQEFEGERLEQVEISESLHGLLLQYAQIYQDIRSSEELDKLLDITK